jgi:hypothetical protein
MDVHIFLPFRKGYDTEKWWVSRFSGGIADVGSNTDCAAGGGRSVDGGLGAMRGTFFGLPPPSATGLSGTPP